MTFNPLAPGDPVLDALQASLSPERFATYLAAAGGNRPEALRLYTWNTALSAAFYGPLQGLEVAVRNAMHRELSARYGPAWYDNPQAGLDAGALDRISAGKDELRRGYGRHTTAERSAMSQPLRKVSRRLRPRAMVFGPAGL